MDTERMINELKRTANKHVGDTLRTFDTNITRLCNDVISKLEQLKGYEDLEEKVYEIFKDQIDIKTIIETFIAYHKLHMQDEELAECLMLVNDEVRDYQRWQMAAEQKRLMELPCEVGTHIYILNHNWIDEGNICGLAECDDTDCACFKVYEDPDTYTMVAFEDFGQTWFLNEKEAERKLKEGV